ncbi:Oidioi.mRNA.OKI2018_I69.PAR.g10919.t1.cds [Oikopleura dioica]|uniref:Oidioi.mRNA.OKI2018_I69.PAR.g10919.t1.cds n=1 Tax=Oikopleura dioica TaxID=34765 RepID=A0ABN7RWC1_OIKDI|nr:Oidioi.mRNA.OKI2018_I69.PAR.g10919.t1.cds [Oikopleura dioica]
MNDEGLDEDSKDDLLRTLFSDENQEDDHWDADSGEAKDPTGLDPDFREALKTNEEFRIWFALMAAFAALIGLGLLYIFAQIFIFKKERFWFFSNMGYFSGELSQISRLGRPANAQSSEMASEKPPEYDDVVKPPSYEEIMSSNRQECEISTATV